MAQMLKDIEVRNLSVGTERKASNGVLTSPILYKGERGCEFQLDSEVTCLFAPSSFENSNRMSVTLLIDEATAGALAALESAVAAAANMKLQHSAIKTREGYSPTLKLRYNAERVQFVDSKGGQAAPPADWCASRFKVIVCLRSVYKQAINSGLMWDLVAAQVLGAIPAKKVTFV
jgi:hypothetical protein